MLHIAEQSPALLQSAADPWLRVRTRMFAALSTVEPPILTLNSFGSKAPSNEGVVPTRDQVASRVD